METARFLFGIVMFFGLTPGFVAGNSLAGMLDPGVKFQGAILSLLFAVVALIVGFCYNGLAAWPLILVGAAVGFFSKSH